MTKKTIFLEISEEPGVRWEFVEVWEIDAQTGESVTVFPVEESYIEEDPEIFFEKIYNKTLFHLVRGEAEGYFFEQEASWIEMKIVEFRGFRELAVRQISIKDKAGRHLPREHWERIVSETYGPPDE